MLLLAGLAQAGPYDTWAKYKTLTINTTNTGGGANVSGTVTNFPVLVRLTTATAEDILDEALANGADLRFASSDGSTALSYQIERWTSTAAEVWVLVPSITGNSTTDIRVYWNKSGQSDASSAASVFSTGNSFAGVWHLSESGSNTVGNYKDATGTTDNTAAAGMTATGAGQVTGVVGNGTAFDGSTSYLGFGAVPGSASSQTVSFWMKADALGYMSVVDKIPNDGTGVGWNFKARNDGGMFYRVGSESNTSDWIKSGTYSAGSWAYITGTFSGGTQNFYVNGTVAGAAMTGVTKTVNNSTTFLRFGIPSAAVTTEKYDGALDEVQISSTARSADWIKLSYQTQRGDATCILYGSTQSTTYYWNRDDILTTSTDFSKAFNWSGNADGTGRRAVSTADDDFSTTSIGGSWTCQDADGNGGTGTCSASTRYGRLTIAGEGTDLWLTTNQYTVLRRSDITGDFDVTVRVDSVVSGHSQAKAGLFMADDFTSLGSGGFAGIAVQGGLKIEMLASTTTAGQNDYSLSSASPVTLPVWLRLVKSGSNVSGYYRTAQSAAWTQQGVTKAVVSTAANSQIGLLFCAHQTGTVDFARFDEFQGGSTLASDQALSFNGTGSNADANATMTANQTAASIDFTGYTGTFNFGAYSLSLSSGNATFISGMTLTPGTGTLAFTGTSGTQVLTPPSGITLPAISSTGAATLQLSTNTLNCVSYTQSAGTLDFNGKDVTTLDDFTLTGGTASSFNNLTGRTLTVGGNASFTGSAGNLVNLNQGAWTITAGGTLTADYATLYGSDASGGTKGIATHSYNAKGNTNWLFSIPATLTNLTKSVRLNFNTTSSGANVPGNVTNIPIFIRFTSANLTFSSTSDSGSDLIFVDKDGTALYHQVVEWDKPNQTGKVWVKVPQVDGNSTTDYITLYYGCDSCTTNSYARSDLVWNDYAAAYHLSGGDANAYDATANAYHGTYQQNQAMITGVTTKLAPVFNGTSDYISTTCPSNVGTRTLSAWIYPKSSDDVTFMESVIDGDVGGQYGSGFGLDNGKIVVLLDNQFWNPNRAITLNAWQHIMVRFNASKAVLFLNGTATDSLSYTQGSVTSSTYTIGKSLTNSQYFDGYLNEVNVADSYRSTDYIKLFYESQKTGSTLLTSYTTASFQNSKVFKLNTTASGANIAADVTNFPLLIRLTGISGYGVTGTGTTIPDDIRFLDDDGVTWLDYQVERWDRGQDSAEVWVRVPTIEGDYAGHTITMWYRQAASVTVVNGECGSCVFQPANGFGGVWQHSESATPTADATGNLNSGTFTGAPAAAAGVIGKSLSFGGTGNYVSVANSSTLSAAVNNRVTISAWVSRSGAGPDSWEGIAGKWEWGAGNYREYDLANNTTASCGFDVNISSNGSGETDLCSNFTPTNNVWYHVAGVADGTKMRIYVNGVEKNNTNYSSAIYYSSNASDKFSIGRMSDNGTFHQYFVGKIDQVEMANVARDSNWIKLAYQNQRRDATPLFNPAPSDFVSTQKYTFNTTKTGANVTGNVADFPLLVRITGSTIIDAVEGTGTNAPPDIRFLDADGKTWLNYVVERWTRTTDSAEVWVQVPQVDGNSDHDYITMYYNSVTTSAIADGQCGSCVFGTANGFAGTWHMDDSASSATVTEVVASKTGTFKNDVTSENTVNHTSAGIIGRSLDFQGGNGGSGGGTQKNNFTHALQWPKTTGTVSHWVKPDQVRTMVSLYESNGTTIGDYNGFGSNGVNIEECQLGIDGTAYGMLYQDGTDGLSLRLSGGTVTAGAWAHVAATWNRSGNAIVYVNGVQVNSAAVSSVSPALSSTTPSVMQAGKVGDTVWVRSWDGAMDEIQVSSVERSADWMKLAYETQRRTGNLFWNGRPGPNNKATLTATATSASNIALSWSSTVSDSSNADSLGIWVGYSGYPDSVGAAATLVAKLPKTDTAYSYPAAYPTTYWFALAVRNSSGQWSPFTVSSSDSATLTGITQPDTIYVDSAIGNNSNSCAQAQNPSTPRLTVTSALTCGASASDTLVVRVMPGTYASDNALAVTSSKPSIVTSFDKVSRAVLAGNGSVAENSLTWNYAVSLSSNIYLRYMDVRANATSNAHNGIYVRYDADNIDIIGNRIYGTASYAFDTSISVSAINCEGILIANNVIHKPNKYGVRMGADDDANVMHNVFIGPGTGTTKGLYLTQASWNTGWFNFTNNIFYNWTTGIETVDGDNEVGNVSNNLYFLVSSATLVTGETDANKVTKDPLFANTTLGNPNAFKLLPGSPAIDAGTSTVLSTSYAYNRFAAKDYFGNSRSLGSAPDIGLYEGTGYTPTADAEFDSLAVSSTASTVTVQNSKWKLVWDKARGAGITEFYDKTTAPSTNLLVSSSLLFDAKIDSYTASSQTGTGPVVSLVESSRARAIVRQRLPVSASVDLNIYYSVYPSGHIYIESELTNLAAATTAVGTVDYTLKLATTTAAFTSADTTKGFGYLTTATRDALLSVTRNLDGGASGTERWSTSTAASGATGTVVFKTTDLADLSQNTVRRHDFLLYIGDNALTFDKAAAINTDAYSPSALSMSAGSLIGERSWQDALQGHWTMDDGAGAAIRDKSVNGANNLALGGANYKWVTGKAGGGIYLTTTDSAFVASASALNASTGFTVMFWLKPDFAGMGDTAMIVSKGLGNTGWNCRKVTGVYKVLFNMGGTTVTSPTLTDGVWTHIAVVANSAGTKHLEMYVNGVQAAASTAAAVTATNAANLVFGYASPGAAAAAKFKGTLDDIRIYGRDLPGNDVQSIYDFGFASKYGQYAVRADNNNRVVALINGGAAQTRVQPAFYISNWFGPRNPKYVFLNGSKLTPLTDYVVDSVTSPIYGTYLTFQLNKILTGADQTLFIDDDDSTGFMGTATAMKSLTITATANKLAIKNFSDTVFSTAASGQWYMELGLKGWTTPTGTLSYAPDSGFGEIMTWKAAAVSPSLAVSSARQLVGYSFKQGRVLTSMKLDATAPETFTSGLGYLSPATNTYTLVDSSSTRLSLTLSADSLTGEGTAAVTKRFTFYPTGRIFVSYQVRNQSINFDTPRLDLSAAYDGGNAAASWSTTTAAANARWALFGGDLNFHPIGMALLSVKNNTNYYTSAASLISSATTNIQTGSSEQSALNFYMQTSLWTSANKPVTVNFVMDFSKRFQDSATADSLLKDSQNPAVLASLTSGTRVTNDALDFNGDNFAEGDGAYTYSATSGVAHFKFTNTVASFYPAFRISSWTQGTLPEFVSLDNQTLVKGYQYNAYLNTASSELIMQFNKALAPGTHVFFISHKSGLAVKLNRFEANGADGVDSLTWTTESEFENLGFHLWRREVPSDSAAAKESARVRDSVLAEHGVSLADAAAKVSVGDSANGPDTLPSLNLTAAELAKLGYVRITPKLIPGAPGGSSATTREYLRVDRTAAFGKAYEYLLEAIDFNDGHVFYGPRGASPGNPYTTEILPNYPNPFNPITTMRFSLREKLKLSLVIYDARGRVVRTLIRPEKPWAAGKYSLIWDARNDLGIEVPSGQYFYRFTAGRYVKARKMILLK